jgi:ABC-type lipoprotein export system ATPase subunit
LKISLQQVNPENIIPAFADRSSIWKSDTVFDGAAKIQIHAPSGSGKTTLINILYGLRHNYTGEVLFDDQNISKLSIAQKAEIRQHHLSVIFQDLRLFSNATGIENILLKSELVKVKTEKQLREMASRLGMEEKLDRPAKTLSQGERQRVAIVRALSQPFDWLFLDEPFSHLDKKNIAIARDLILEIVDEQNAGLIIVGLGYDYGINADQELNL